MMDGRCWVWISTLGALLYQCHIRGTLVQEDDVIVSASNPRYHARNLLSAKPIPHLAVWRDVNYSHVCGGGVECRGSSGAVYRGKVSLAKCKEFCYRELTCTAFEVIGCKSDPEQCGRGCWLYHTTDLRNHDFSANIVGESACKEITDLRCYRMTGELDWRRLLHSLVLEIRAKERLSNSSLKGNTKRLRRDIHAWDAKIALPFFDSLTALRENKRWMGYLQSVYGSTILEPSNYPIDVSNFWLLYHTLLHRYRLRLYPSGLPNYDYARHTCWMGALHPNAFLVYHNPPYRGFPSDSYVEVMHLGGVAQTPWEGKRGYWMYGVRGSGVFYNLGRTITFNTHSEAVRKILGINCGGQCQEHYIKLYRKAGEKFKSIQFTKHCDQCNSNLCSHEILDLHGVGVDSCSVNFTLGLGGHKHPCHCHHFQAFLDCRNLGRN